MKGYLLLKLQNNFLNLLVLLRRTVCNSNTPFPSFGFPFLAFLEGDSAKTQYNEILANVDYLHGIAESFLTITNLLIVAAFRKAVMSRERKPAEGEGQQGPV